MKCGKKGFLMMDVIIVIIGLFVIAIGVLIAAYVFTDNLHPAIEEQFNSTTVHKSMMAAESMLDIFDYLFIFIAIGFGVALIISAFLIKSHPAFAFIIIFSLLMFLVFAAIFSNVFTEFATEPQLSATADEYPVIQTIMDNLPIYVLIMAAITGIVMYAKARSESVL